MNPIKNKLDEIMVNIQKTNPNANWANLFTGVALLLMVAVFSYAYFSKSKESQNTERDLSYVNTKTAPEYSDIEVVKAGSGGDKSGTVIVEKGEGLWHVAKRVCGDGEKYNILARANNLQVWEELNEGMSLKVVCE